MFFGWFGTVIGESERGIYNLQVDRSFRMGMMWFIFSEVMFFAAFFGALFYAREFAVPWLGGEGAKSSRTCCCGRTSSRPGRPTARHTSAATFEIIPAFGLPALNTAILLTSGVTVTIAHHALRAGKRGMLDRVPRRSRSCWASCSSACRRTSTARPTSELNLKLSTGVYGSTFFMLTGFHGLHVTLGAIMLLVIWLRVLQGHFTPQRHFAFEASPGTGTSSTSCGWDSSSSSTGCRPRRSLPHRVRREQPARIREHEQCKQQHRQADAPGERAQHLLRITLAARQMKQGRSQAHNDGDQHQDD